jgi:hypothetical protein
LTPEEIRVRETFNRADHLAGVKPQPAQSSTMEVKVFDEAAIRAALSQDGLDFAYQIFPIGEKPADATGRSANREARITELENEQPKFRKRATDAEAITAAAVREVADLKKEIENLNVANATLLSELEKLKSAPPVQEAV